METSPLAVTPFEIAWGIYGVTVFAALLATVWAVATKRLTGPEAVLAVVAAVAVPVLGSLAVLGWLITAAIQGNTTAIQGKLTGTR